jgi:hypothetical protein
MTSTATTAATTTNRRTMTIIVELLTLNAELDVPASTEDASTHAAGLLPPGITFSTRPAAQVVQAEPLELTQVRQVLSQRLDTVPMITSATLSTFGGTLIAAWWEDVFSKRVSTASTTDAVKSDVCVVTVVTDDAAVKRRPLDGASEQLTDKTFN